MLTSLVQELTGARSVQPGERIQSLWSGYGEVRRMTLRGGPAETVVVKHVRPPPDAHPRKLRSYRVERAFYEGFAPRAGGRVARWLGGWSRGDESVFVLEDLDAAGFSRRRMGLSQADTRRALAWLARFHAAFLGVRPEGLWETGTYWHLGTRPEELERMRDQDLREEAPALDAALSGARFQTLVHGDAKAANLLFSREGDVAAVDFQYTGGGPGIRDVAYLLEGFRWGRGGREALLDHYFQELATALGGRDAALESEWRDLYPVAVRDFERFLDGWR